MINNPFSEFRRKRLIEFISKLSLITNYKKENILTNKNDKNVVYTGILTNFKNPTPKKTLTDLERSLERFN